jgi:hypothetical protein
VYWQLNSQKVLLDKTYHILYYDDINDGENIMELSVAQKNLVEKIKESYPNSHEFRLKDLKDLAGTIKVSATEVDNLVRKLPRVSRGISQWLLCHSKKIMW